MWFEKEDKRSYRMYDEKDFIEIWDDVIGLPKRVGIISDEIMPLDKINSIQICNMKNIDGSDIPNKFCIVFDVDRCTADIAKIDGKTVTFDDRHNEYKIFSRFAGVKRKGILHRICYAFTKPNGDEIQSECYIYK
jgi:hypothetical protein